MSLSEGKGKVCLEEMCCLPDEENANVPANQGGAHKRARKQSYQILSLNRQQWRRSDRDQLKRPRRQLKEEKIGQF